ncbi:hypothetical protein HF086_003235 [Spodoptera exigua]|uniref:Mutator-like transposase domain-containing protein n=1 Tax=Spodoptera exigua TaxID=7107 RepID=A0A922MGW0_SPOEX|nr:hypothetical protein HF086_003235 [Spodoptera exigua]
MKTAGEREREAAINEGKVTKDGIALIDVIADGCWSKRSYKSNYAALSGAAAIVGRRFGQILFMSVKNKYCCICARSEKRNTTPRAHQCFKNYSEGLRLTKKKLTKEGDTTEQLKDGKTVLCCQKKLDFNYGENVEAPDMDAETYQNCKTTFEKFREMRRRKK